MEIHIIDLKTNEIVKVTDFEHFENIDIGHKIIVDYKDINGTKKHINGTICSIEHELYQTITSFEYIFKIKIY